MTRQEMEQTVANLLIEQRRFRRLGTDLPPDKLALLQRLLYRLGYTKMSRKPKVVRYGRLTIGEGEPLMGGADFMHQIHDENGTRIGHIWVSPMDGGERLHINHIGANGHKANSLGSAVMRDGLKQLKKYYPTARRISGRRISGATHNNTGETRDVNMKMSRVKKYSEEVQPEQHLDEEEAFQSHLDKNPDDHHHRMVFADWLEERGDPRAEGYRAMGMLRKRSHQSIYHPQGGTWLWGTEKNKSNMHNYRGAELPQSWLEAINNTHPGYGIKGITTFWKYHNNRREADNEAALAFTKLPKQVKKKLLARVRMSRGVKKYALIFDQDRSGGHSRVNEDLRLFRKHVRSLHATAPRGGVQPNSSQERSLLHDFSTTRGLKVKQSPYTYYDEQHHTMYHPNPTDKVGVAEAYMRHGGEALKLSKPKGVLRYAKFNHSTPAHPLVSGFPIEHALRHLANSPSTNDNARNLAVAALKGHTEALWGLHDELHSHENADGTTGHPILKAGYKWLNAADKLHLDKHTYTALNEAAERRRAEEPHATHYVHKDTYIWRYTPESHALRAVQALNPTSDTGTVDGDLANTVRSRVKQLSPNSTDEDIHESIKRHAHRANQELRRRHLMHGTDEADGRALQDPKESKDDHRITKEHEIATRYNKKVLKYSLANKSNFIGALLKASSPEHKMFVKRSKELAKKVGAQETKEFSALHDTPYQSVPGVAMAIYGSIQPDSAHALGSWVNGLLPNGPGYAVFHSRPTGPDTLYRIRMEGSGHDARMKLDRAGIGSRVFVPHKKGLDVLVPDKGNQFAQQVQQFASEQKVPVESSPGHFMSVGSQDQAQARDTFRNKITKVEQMTRRESAKKYAAEAKINKPKRRTDGPRDANVQQYEPGLLPPTGKEHEYENIHDVEHEPWMTDHRERTRLEPGDTVDKLPKGVKQKDWNPSMVPPGEKTPFNSAEYNKLHAWAHKHAFTHTPAFAKFLGVTPERHPKLHQFLVDAIIQAAHHMRNMGTDSATVGIGKIGKKLKINIPNRKSWEDVKPTGKTVKLPKPVKNQRHSNIFSIDLEPYNTVSTVSKYSRRRRVLCQS